MTDRILDWFFALSGGWQIAVLMLGAMAIALILGLLVKFAVAILDRTLVRSVNFVRGILKRRYDRLNPPRHDFGGMSEYQIGRLERIDPYLFSLKVLNMPIVVSFKTFKSHMDELVGENEKAQARSPEERAYFIEHGTRVAIARGWA
jgi:hypothetical protein